MTHPTPTPHVPIRHAIDEVPDFEPGETFECAHCEDQVSVEDEFRFDRESDDDGRFCSGKCAVAAMAQKMEAARHDLIDSRRERYRLEIDLDIARECLCSHSDCSAPLAHDEGFAGDGDTDDIHCCDETCATYYLREQIVEAECEAKRECLLAVSLSARVGNATRSKEEAAKDRATNAKVVSVRLCNETLNGRLCQRIEDHAGPCVNTFPTVAEAGGVA